ncbi:hypothetical protein [Nonomuraea salmonea]|uniref:hypothetical protein n=1 Tax=Nonomuraea salmonea TaxID=46181 RepID=UPI0031E5C227
MDQVGEDGDAGVAFVQNPQGGGQDRPLGVGHRAAADDGDEGGDGVQAAAVRVGQQALPVQARQARGGGADLAGVEDVQGAEPAAELDDLAAHGRDQVGVVGLQIAQHQRGDAVAGQADDLAAYQRGLAQPRLAEHELRRVVDETGAGEPGDRVAAQGRAAGQLAPERHADRRRAEPDPERPQPAHLHGGAAPLRGRLDVRYAATAAPGVSARAEPRGGVRHGQLPSEERVTASP